MSSGLGPSGGPVPARSRAATTVLVVIAAVVLFAVGFGVSWLLRGGNNAPDASGPPTPAPTCVTTSAVPAVALPKPGTVSINVYNATSRTGLAARTAATLKSAGFVVGTIANDPLGKTIKGTAELRYGPKGKKNAELLRFYVPGAVLVLDNRTDTSVDVVLGDKFTAVRSPTAVQAAMNKPVVTTTGPGCPKPTS